MKLLFDLGIPYQPNWPGRPPQLLPRDVPVWQAYRQAHIADYIKFYYNVALSVRPLEKRKTAPAELKLFLHTLGKRIDVVAEAKDIVTLIEVTRHAQVRSIGQAITYRDLWMIAPPIDKPYKTMILCTHTDEDIEYVARTHNIFIVTVEI